MTIIRVRATTDVAKLAQSITKSIRGRQGPVEVRAVGQSANYVAIRAIAALPALDGGPVFVLSFLRDDDDISVMVYTLHPGTPAGHSSTL